MSIPLSESPFDNNFLPCTLCAESEGKIICTHFGGDCKNVRQCKMYSPVESKEYRDNLEKSLRPTWIQTEYDTYYVDECSRCHGRMPRNQWNRPYSSKYCPTCGKRLYLKDEEVEDVEPGIYQHFKGRQYKVLCVGQHTETNEKFVVYQALYGKYVVYIRPIKMFTEDIEDLSYHYRGPRFFRVDTED